MQVRCPCCGKEFAVVPEPMPVVPPDVLPGYEPGPFPSWHQNAAASAWMARDPMLKATCCEGSPSDPGDPA